MSHASGSGVPADRVLVAAVLGRLVPEGSCPGEATAALAELDRHATGDHRGLWEQVLGPGIQALDAEARARHARGFAQLDPSEQDELLRGVEAGQATVGWPVPPQRFMATIVRLAAESTYGRRDSPLWDAIGYRAGPRADPARPVEHRTARTSSFAALADAYDVVVVGAGAGGGVAAWVLAEAGARVLVVERGRSLTYAQVGRDHLRNHRLSLYGLNTETAEGADPRVVVDSSGAERVIRRPHHPAWSNNARTVGGGTRVYQGMAWRFLPDDFEMASRYGVPAGSSLADWPIRYDDLEGCYDRVEWLLGVAGEDGAHPAAGPRRRGYPMPPPPWTPEAEVLRRGAERLGWPTGAVPLAVNTVARDGRGPCVACGECVGFACPTDAKGGTHNVWLPRATATGNAALVPRCRALGLTMRRGKVDGVELVDLDSGGRRLVRSRHVVLAAGAVESARLLLLAGLGGEHVGRHLQGHCYVSAFGRFDEEVADKAGPGVRIATLVHNHRAGPDVIGGGALHDEVVKLPILHWYWALPPDAPRWGAAGLDAMAELYLRTSHVHGCVQEIPHPDLRVTLAPGVLDAHGVPAVRLQGRLHPETLRTAAALADRARQWLEASGATRTWTAPLSDAITAGQHQAGTCRMGQDPSTSVTDPWGRVHGHDNLWVMDGSLHVTNGGVNPVLTIYALALRCAGQLAAVS